MLIWLGGALVYLHKQKQGFILSFDQNNLTSTFPPSHGCPQIFKKLQIGMSEKHVVVQYLVAQIVHNRGHG
jgi:hypothetical protein